MPPTRKPSKKSVYRENRLNDLDSRSWLQFQKSWFILSSFPETVAEFIAFFTRQRYPDGHTGSVLVDAAAAHPLTAPGRKVLQIDDLREQHRLDYAFIDARHLEPDNSRAWREMIERIARIAAHLRPQAYLTVAACNRTLPPAGGRSCAGQTYPLAWLLAREIAKFLAQKDEKIGCTPGEIPPASSTAFWTPAGQVTYFLNFRRQSDEIKAPTSSTEPFWPLHKDTDKPGFPTNGFRESWFIHKPPPRSKEVLTHPAKFPEKLIARYIRTFTRRGETVFDPMAGTGSALLAAVETGRRACGIELNPEFVAIARDRFPSPQAVQLVTGDAADPASYRSLPSAFDYCITSPPYWDMLRMRGAETQARRKKEGLLRWYSDEARDIGNLADYAAFLDALEVIYTRVAKRLRPGRYMTIIVKNVKKKGVIYPLAWDLVDRLNTHLIFAGEQFWCQDDQRLAPFGYLYAWVSNTFHHYCLTFRKP